MLKLYVNNKANFQLKMLSTCMLLIGLISNRDKNGRRVRHSGN